MFEKLRIKFIAIIMASVAIVLAVAFSFICISEYQRSLNLVNTSLENALNQAIEFNIGNMNGLEDRVPPDEGMAPDSFDDMGASGKMGTGHGGGRMEQGTASWGDGNPQRIGGRGNQRNQDLIAVAVYTVSDDNSLTTVTNVTRASISTEILSEAGELALEASSDSGTLDAVGLHYARRTVEGVTYLAFADTANTSNWQSLSLTLVVAGLIVLAIFFIISLFFSKWALAPVKTAWNSQRQFVADASHELKTPLTVVLANASILLKHPGDTIASQSKWIESTQVEAENMQSLVNEMLELAQVEERAGIQHVPVDLSDLVDGEVLQFESVAFENGCMLNSAIEEGITIQGDATRLKKMVSTIIENALKYAGDGGTARVDLARTGKNATIAINNSGSVISPEDLPHIFDRFYRTDKARTSGTGGYGLGLALAREIAREHDGDITCVSNEASGTTFTITLPIA